MDISPLLVATYQALQHIIYPPICLICNKPGKKEQDLCESCEQALPWLKQTCVQCALPLPEDSSDFLLCGRCLKKPPFFDLSLSLFGFEKDIVVLIHQLKFHNKLAVSRLLSGQLNNTVMNTVDKPDCLLPVPLHKKRLRHRGFNQSIEIARTLSKTWSIPIEYSWLKRTRATQPQTGLDAKSRRRNIKGAFEMVEKKKYQHVAIIDDVVTTGSTVNEIARVLKRSGVKKVSVYSIARAL